MRHRATLASVALLGVLALGSAALAGGRPLSADMTGDQEVPGPGDADGTGTALITLNQGQGEVCWDISVENIELPAAAAHIHPGAAGEANSPIITLSAPDGSGTASGCTDGVDRALIKDIRQHPDQYYVNVHNSEFPAGAVRGQLSK